ncbi:MAG: FtsX-like permease family protein [bacterium]
MPLRLLVRGQWRSRRRRQLAVGATLAVGLLAVLCVGMLLDGAREAIIRPVHDTLSGDVRVTAGSSDLAAGLPWADARPVQAEIRVIPGAVAAPRWEASHVTARQDRVENWTAGILVGIDPTIVEEQAPLQGYLVWGTTLPTAPPIDPRTQLAYVPLLVGEEAARRLDLHPGPGGGPNFAEALRITSGRFVSGTSAPPLDRPAVVVGVFRSGLDALDRFVAFAPIGDARFLSGRGEGDPSANAIVVHGASLGQVQALGLGLEAQDADGVARVAMGLVLAVVDVAAIAVLALVTVLLAVLLVREVSLQVARDAPAIAALRAIGVPARTIAGSYTVLAGLTVAGAVATATLVAIAIAWFAPSISVLGHGLAIHVPWVLRAAPLVAMAVAAVALAVAAALAASRRLARLNVAEALRPS